MFESREVMAMSAPFLCPTVCDVMNKAGMCDTRVFNNTIQTFSATRAT